MKQNSHWQGVERRDAWPVWPRLFDSIIVRLFQIQWVARFSVRFLLLSVHQSALSGPLLVLAIRKWSMLDLSVLTLPFGLYFRRCSLRLAPVNRTLVMSSVASSFYSPTFSPTDLFISIVSCQGQQVTRHLLESC